VTHPEPERLLAFAEGAENTADVAAHVAACASCRAALAEVARLEDEIATSSVLPADEHARLQVLTSRLLTAPPRRRPMHRLAGFVVVALAAGLWALLALWPSADGLRCDIRRYKPDNVVRAEVRERFALEVEFTAPRWLALWQLDSPMGRLRPPALPWITRLMPQADPLLRWLGAEMPLAAGKHRVPATEALDFEFVPIFPPDSLVLVPTVAELAAADLAAIETTIADTPRAELETVLRRRWPESRVVPFPAR
jgi:hypothetical protein